MKLTTNRDHRGRITIDLREPDTFTDLLVEANEFTDIELDAAFRTHRLGSIEGSHAWLNIDELAARGPGNEEWRRRFTAMIEYADRKGWVDQTHGAVRAHLVRGGTE